MPLALERPQVEEELKSLENRIKELTADLKKRGALIFCVIFFILGAVEFLFGLDGDDALLIIGGFCGAGFGIASIVIAIHRASLRRQLRECQGKIVPLRKRLEEINGCMSFGEFARTYKLRQTEEGRAQLEEEEKQRKLQEERARVEAKRARRKKLIKRVLITTVILLLIDGSALAGWYYMFHYLPGEQVKAAEALMAAGDYRGAYDILHNINYANSEELKEDIAEKGKYAVTDVVVDDADYRIDASRDWITYNEHGLPSAFYTELDKGQAQMSYGLEPDYKFEYTFYTSGNLETCSVYARKYYDGAYPAEGEIWYPEDPYYLYAVITFYDVPEAAIAFLPGDVRSQEQSWYEFSSAFLSSYGMKQRDVKSVAYYDWMTGELTRTQEYQENGFPVETVCETDEQGRVIYYYVPEIAGAYRLTYNEDGTIATMVIIDDRNQPNSIWNETLIFERTYTEGKLTEWTVYPERTDSMPKNKEVYTYDETGKILSLTVYEQDKGSLKEVVSYTFTHTWLDYDALAAEAEQQRQEELRKQEEERQKAQEELDRKKNAYAAADALAAEGRTAEAAIAFGKLAGFEDAEERCRQLWREMSYPTFAAARAHIVMLKNDGSVDATGAEDDGRCDVSDWTGVVSVAAINGQTFGLRLDGTVLATGYNEYGQCDVEDWENIVAISTSAFHTVGLKTDGTVVATGYNEYGQCDVGDWTDIVSVSANNYHTVGLKADGTVVAVGYGGDGQCDVGDWTDIVAICTLSGNTYGLKSDGTVVAVGDNYYGQRYVEGWTNIVALSADTGYVVGLRADGTVVAAGNNDYDQCSVYYWTNIVAVATKNSHVVGLRADGTMIARGYNGSGQCEIEGWTDVVALSVSEFETVGLTSDGRILVASHYVEEYDQSKFENVMVPENLIPEETVVEEENNG